MDVVIGFLEGLTFWHWFVLAAVLIGIELITGSLVLLWPAAAAVLVGLAVLGPGPLPWQAQFLVFAILLLVLSLSGERFIRPRWLASDRPHLSSRADQLIGERARVVVAFSGGAGRVEVAGTQWPATVLGDDAPGAGDWVDVLGVDGATLEVRVRR